MEINHSKSNARPSTLTALALAVSAAFTMPVQTVHAQGAVLEEVVVTARKREESMQEVPVAVSVLSEESLSNGRIEGISDLGTVVPGLVTGNVAAGTSGSIYLRGVGTGAGNPTFDQAVAINIDGVGISSAQLMNAGMFDLEQIEVLRGPQALFYGKNSPGGVIAVHTKDPGDEFEAQVSGHFETETEETAIRGVVSGPLGDRVGGRLSFGWTENDNNGFTVENEDLFLVPGVEATQIGFATDSNPVSNENLFVMGTLVWDPSDTVSVNFKYAHIEDDQEGMTGYNAQRIVCPQGAPNSNSPVPATNFDDCDIDDNVQMTGLSPVITAADPNYPGHTGNGFNTDESDFAALTITVDLSDSLTLTSVTGYFENEVTRFSEASYDAFAFLGNSGNGTLEQYSQELRVNSSFDGSVNFTAGLYYEEKEISNLNSITALDFVTLTAAPVGTHLVDTEATAYSAFAQVEWEIDDQWTLAAGARYSYEEKEGVIGAQDLEATSAAVFGPANAVSSVTAPLVDDNPDWSNFSPELTLRYQASDDVMFFASYKTAFKSGGIDGAFLGPELLLVTEPLDAIYDEETIAGFEVGMKSTLADGTLRLNVTAYTFDYEDMQLSNLETGAFGPTLTTFNAGDASLEGIEIETIWLTPVEGLTLTVNAALSNNEFDEYIANCLAGQTVALGCDVDSNGDGIGDGADKAGESLPNSSDLSATFGVDYQLTLSDNWGLGLNLSTSYKDEYNPSPELLPKDFYQESYWWTNAAVSLYSLDDAWEFYLRGVNLGDEYFTTNQSTIPGQGDATQTGVNTGNSAADDRQFLGDMFGFVDGGRRITLGFTYRM